MRRNRIIMALAAGLALVAAVPVAAGAAQPQPLPDPTPSASVTQPPPDYPPVTTLTVDPTTTTPGQLVTLNGTGFLPNELVDIDVTITGLPIAAPAAVTARRADGSTVAMAAVAYAAAPNPAPSYSGGGAPPVLHFTVRADAFDDFVTSYRATRPGVYTFTATGRTSGRTAQATLTVIAGPPATRPPHHRLPVTGASLGTPMKLGGGLVGAGAVMVLLTLAWRRRRLDG
ncbi:hypothetical protein [Micromonospora mirobrigensis]|uniref:IPT/TIG domain-containing protein n=1 Tax=Micromonospora mirobrigensis TaxID=262898 RepID=A0A1C4WFH5_9ACTN|nr:hypothetical protein [Micromonospora mirobrigensis]SCE94953.1 hypothetical protein GA0070564_102229 [Micromonospora mirobrigensis]